MYPVTLSICSGNLRGGFSPRDKDELAPDTKDSTPDSNSLVWEDRIPIQVGLILGAGADIFFATECREENDMYLLLRDALRKADPASSWEADKGENGNQCFYRGSILSFTAHSDHKYSATPGTDRYFVHTTLTHTQTGSVWEFVNTHMHPFEPEARIQDAKEVRDYMATRNIDVFLGDFNSTTERSGQPRDIWRKAGWLQMHERGVVQNYEMGSGPSGQHIEDIYTKSARISNISGMHIIASRVAMATDHVGWLAASVTRLVDYSPPSTAIAAEPITSENIGSIYFPPVETLAYNYIVQNVLTGQFLTRELPLKSDGPSYELSAAGSLSGTISPELRYKIGLEEWQTAIYAEANGEIRWGGLIISLPSVGSELSVEAAGFVTYPNGEPYAGKLYKKVDWSPLQAYKDLWTYLQGRTDSNLGVTVVLPTEGVKPAPIGTKDEPYILAPEEAPDIGDEMSRLVTETPFEFIERHSWVGTSDKIKHEIIIGSPRLGRKRLDLAFVQGDNVISVVPVDRDGDAYGNAIYGIGKGEGKGTVRVEIAQRDGRLRRTKVFTDKTANTEARLGKQVQREFAKQQLLPEISSITVRHHPNAPIGSWSLGDDILVQAHVPWEGDVAIWSRIVSWSMSGVDKAVLTLSRSDIEAGVSFPQNPGPLLPSIQVALPGEATFYSGSTMAVDSPSVLRPTAVQFASTSSMSVSGSTAPGSTGSSAFYDSAFYDTAFYG